VHTTHAILHTRRITLPNPKRGGLLYVKLIKSINQIKTCVCKHDNLGRRPYLRVHEDTPANTLAAWMEIEPMPSRHTAWGVTTRPDVFK